jgi:hypothetical protein
LTGVDAAATIDYYYKTPSLIYKAPETDKHLRRAYITGSTGTGRSLTVDYTKDTIAASDTSTVSLVATGAEVVTTKTVDFPQTAEAKMVGLILTDVSTRDMEIDSIEVYSYIQKPR